MCFRGGEPNGRDISLQRVCMDKFANGTTVSIEEVVESLGPSTVISVAADRITDAIQKRYPSQN